MPGNAPPFQPQPVPAVEAAPADLRVLVLSPLHPAVSRSRVALAAWQTYLALKASPGVTAWFLAAAGGRIEAPLGSVIFQPFGPDEFICADGGYDPFRHAGHHDGQAAALAALLQRLRPDVVHLHHCAHFGIEVLLHIRRALPGVRIILTLHDGRIICHHDGQMMTRPDLLPCPAASPRACAACFPGRHANDFFLRDLYLRRFLDLVDQFIAPDRFLAARHIAWGLPAGRLHLLETGQPGPDPAPLPLAEHGLVFGCFDPVPALKGAELLLAAAAVLAARPPTAPLLRLEIHGDAGHPSADPALAARLQAAAGPGLSLRGPWARDRLHRLMQDCHAILVPGPGRAGAAAVIRAAFAAGRPVICADIDGIADAVRDGVDGFHFRAGSPHALAALLTDLARDPDRICAAAACITPPPDMATTLARLRAIYALPGRAPADPGLPALAGGADVR